MNSDAALEKYETNLFPGKVFRMQVVCDTPAPAKRARVQPTPRMDFSGKLFLD